MTGILNTDDMDDGYVCPPDGMAVGEAEKSAEDAAGKCNINIPEGTEEGVLGNVAEAMENTDDCSGCTVGNSAANIVGRTLNDTGNTTNRTLPNVGLPLTGNLQPKHASSADLPVDNNGFGYKISKVVSVAFHPFFVPVYLIAFFLMHDEVFAMTPLRTKLFFGGIVLLCSLVIPAFSVGLLRATGFISGFSFRHRQDRSIPIAIIALMYGVCIYMLSDFVYGFMIRKFLISFFCCAVVTIAIVPFWRVSVYMIAAGAATGLLMLFAVAGIGSMFLPAMTACLISGILGSARLRLGMHDLAQVLTGFLIGSVVASASMLFIR